MDGENMSNLIVAFPNPEDAKAIRNLLVRKGFHVIASCTSGAQVLSQISDAASGIVISGYKLKDMTYLELKEYLPPGNQLLLLATRKLLEESLGEEVFRLEMPLKPDKLVQTLEIMEQTAYRERRKRRQNPIVRSEADREILAQAKKCLMEQNNMTEDEAHKYMQKTSMDCGRNMVETARMVLSIMEK